MDEKFKPHYSLAKMQQLIRDDQCTISVSAQNDGHSLGFSETDIYQTVLDLKGNEFCKSMTSYWNRQLWQDVYKTVRKEVKLYIKLQITTGTVVISFKEDQPEE
jgi:motility quorum-sensing regulator/GCU-specific mRNA interferase toxin